MPRPVPRFQDFIGRKRTVDYLRRLLTGARARDEPFPHALFMGPSGAGKTLLARALATEFDTTVINAMGYDTREKLAQKLSELRACDFLFIDESHRLGPYEQELLCEAITDQSIPNLHGTGGQNTPEEERVSVQPWTLVLATDQPGCLLNALLKRIVIRVPLGFYPPRELREIVAALAAREKLLLSPQAMGRIATASGRLPRRAEHLLLELRRFFPDSETRQLSLGDVRTFLRARGEDRAGLDPLARRYLRALARRGTLSLQSLVLLLDIADPAYLKREVEAPLVRRGLVEILPRGRRLTPRGRKLVGRGKRSESEVGQS